MDYHESVVLVTSVKPGMPLAGGLSWFGRLEDSRTTYLQPVFVGIQDVGALLVVNTYIMIIGTL